LRCDQHHQGGLRIYPASETDKLLDATERFFYENTDPKASIITTLDGRALGVSVLALFVYDGPEKPAAFDMFDGIPALLDGAGQKTWKGLINSFPSTIVLNARGTFATFSTTELTGRFLNAIKEEAAVSLPSH